MVDVEMVSAPSLRVVSPKPKMTIYYALLIIALLAMLTGCLFLYLEIRRFGGFGAVKGRFASRAVLQEPLVASAASRAVFSVACARG